MIGSEVVLSDIYKNLNDFDLNEQNDYKEDLVLEPKLLGNYLISDKTEEWFSSISNSINTIKNKSYYCAPRYEVCYRPNKQFKERRYFNQFGYYMWKPENETYSDFYHSISNITEKIVSDIKKTHCICEDEEACYPYFNEQLTNTENLLVDLFGKPQINAIQYYLELEYMNPIYCLKRLPINYIFDEIEAIKLNNQPYANNLSTDFDRTIELSGTLYEGRTHNIENYAKVGNAVHFIFAKDIFFLKK